jgi:hypothetical protein
VLIAASGDAMSGDPGSGRDRADSATGDALVAPTDATAPITAPALAVHPALPIGVAREKGLQVKTILAARAVSAQFPEILDIGGQRADPLKWHPHGLAIDVMIPNYGTPEGRALGDRVLAYVLANSERFGVQHVIWRQTLYSPTRPPRKMRNLGSDDANHYSHVHVATVGGGYPHGDETYLR